MDSDRITQLIYLGLILAAVSGWVMVEYRGRLGQAMRAAMGWGLIFVGVAAGYALWSDIRHSEQPIQAMVQGRIEVPRAPDGHYYLTLQVNGAPVTFLVDTGATNIVLSRRDAEAAGIDPGALAYIGSANTANGTVSTARVRLDSLALGDVVDAGISAYVTSGAMMDSLLGMDYLRRYRIEIEPGYAPDWQPWPIPKPKDGLRVTFKPL